MDFTNRSTQPAAAPSSHATAPAGRPKRNSEDNKWTRVGAVVAVVIVGLLLAAVALTIGGTPTNPESKYVDQNKLQAVFLNTGQVYFGNVKTLNNKYLVLNNIYYLQTANNNSGSSSSNNNNSGSNVTLVKLGCELHEPFDQMVINRDQVTFWENLQDNGQVAKAVNTFEKENPNGQKCSDQSNSSANTSNSVQNATSGNNATPETTKKQ